MQITALVIPPSIASNSILSNPASNDGNHNVILPRYGNPALTNSELEEIVALMHIFFARQNTTVNNPNPTVQVMIRVNFLADSNSFPQESNLHTTYNPNVTASNTCPDVVAPFQSVETIYILLLFIHVFTIENNALAPMIKDNIVNNEYFSPFFSPIPRQYRVYCTQPIMENVTTAIRDNAEITVPNTAQNVILPTYMP